MLRGGGASRQPVAASKSQFMYFMESKPKFLSPNSFSTMAISLWIYRNRQRTEEVYTSVTVCVITHSHKHACGARTFVAHCLIGRPNSLGRQGKERGGACPLMMTYGATFQIIPFFLNASRIPSGCYSPNANFSHFETRGRIGELILMFENLIK